LAVGKETLEKERLERIERTDETTDVVGFAGASKRYGEVRAVDGLDLAIGRGETVTYPTKYKRFRFRARFSEGQTSRLELTRA
jgi:hypothetical protein